MGGLSGALRGWTERLAALERRYFAVDGGSGAALLAELPAVDDRLRPTDAPRHADLLLVVEPVTERLLDALAETYRSAGQSPPVVAVGAPGPDRYGPGTRLARLEEHLPVVLRIEADPTGGSARRTAQALALAIRGQPLQARTEVPEGAPEEVFIPLRSAGEREIATEDVVLSIGPIQQAAAGPVRLLLLMDGEQVVRAEVRSGYAAREIERLSCQRTWVEGLSLSAALDPLAPIAGRMAYAQALEVLHGVEPPPRALRLRESALRRERAANHLFWLVRFADLLAYPHLAREARHLAAACAATLLPSGAVVPGGWEPAGAGPSEGITPGLIESVRRLEKTLRADRLFGLRTRGVGVLSAARAREVGASGPVRIASETSDGDAWARTLARLEAAAEDLLHAVELLAHAPEGEERVPWPAVPPARGAAESEVTGPRGRMLLELESGGENRPSGVHWARPSALHLALVPELVAGRTLPDALTAVASLDLSMAEADG